MTGQPKDVVIYDGSISKNFEDAIMEEYNALQIINFSSMTVKFNSASPVSLLVFMTFIFTTKTDKVSCTFKIIPLIIPFDRGRVHC